jgi:hypothetical protein
VTPGVGNFTRTHPGRITRSLTNGLLYQSSDSTTVLVTTRTLLEGWLRDSPAVAAVDRTQIVLQLAEEVVDRVRLADHLAALGEPLERHAAPCAHWPLLAPWVVVT